MYQEHTCIITLLVTGERVGTGQKILGYLRTYILMKRHVIKHKCTLYQTEVWVTNNTKEVIRNCGKKDFVNLQYSSGKVSLIKEVKTLQCLQTDLGKVPGTKFA